MTKPAVRSTVKPALKLDRLGKTGVKRAVAGTAMEDGGARGRRSPLFPELNLNQTAQQLGIGRANLSLIMNGHRRPRAEMARKIALALGWTIQDLAKLYRGKKVKPSKLKELKGEK